MLRMISGYWGLQKHPWGLACAESLWDDLAANRGSPSLPGGAVNQRSGLRRRCQRGGHNASCWAAEGCIPPPGELRVSPQREKPPAREVAWSVCICIFGNVAEHGKSQDQKNVHKLSEKRLERKKVFGFFGRGRMVWAPEHLHCPLMASWQDTNPTESRIPAGAKAAHIKL